MECPPTFAMGRVGLRFGRGREAIVVEAYILIQTGVGKGGDVTLEVARLQGVTLADAVTGPYDVIAHANARTLDDLTRTVVARIHEIPGVTRTLTCAVAHL
jgi:DNA-binding Lrp family transcriptional regulator